MYKKNLQELVLVFILKELQKSGKTIDMSFGLTDGNREEFCKYAGEHIDKEGFLDVIKSNITLENLKCFTTDCTSICLTRKGKEVAESIIASDKVNKEQPFSIKASGYFEKRSGLISISAIFISLVALIISFLK